MTSPAKAEFSLSVDEDLPMAWDRVIRQLEKSCELDLSLPRTEPIEMLIDKIESPRRSLSDTTQRREIFKQTLKFVDICASLITQGVAVVFSPSTQIYNAISSIIQICQKTQDVFDTITALMDRLRAFLEILSSHLERLDGQEKLDKKLRRSVYRVLEQFVKILAETYKRTKSWRGTLSVAFHIAVFAEYPAIKTAMEKFDGLVLQVTHEQINQVYLKMHEYGRKAAEALDEIQTLNAMTAQGAAKVDHLVLQESEKRIRTEIKIALGIDWDREQDHIRAHNENEALPRTGAWLFQGLEFSNWMDYRDGGTVPQYNSILQIQGPSGYGKSCLTHAVIEQLQRKSRLLKQQGVTMRVAWYYFTETPSRTSLQMAMRYVIWQLALLDAPYMKFLRSWNQERYNNPDEVDFLQELLVDYSKKQPSTTFFIVLDGIDHAGPDCVQILQKLLSATFVAPRKSSDIPAPEALRIQLLLTGTKSAFDEVRSRSNVPFKCIDLEPRSAGDLPYSNRIPQQPDIKAFIYDRLQHSKVFQKDQHKDLKDRAVEVLARKAKGNYTPLEQQLNAIVAYEDARKVDIALDDIDGGKADFIKDEIRTLNNGGNAPYIPQINELLTWIAVVDHLDSEVVQSIISLKFEGAGLADAVQYLETHCPQLLEFSVYGDTTSIAFMPEAKERLKIAKDSRTKLELQEIQMVKDMVKENFVKVFGLHNKIYSRFEFQQFFDAKSTVHTELVHLRDNDEANALTVLKTCLIVLSDTSDLSEHRALRHYASGIFEVLFARAKAAIRDDSGKQQIGRQLYRLLSSDTLIDAWTSPKDRFWTMLNWLDDDNTTCANFHSLLFEPAVKKAVQSSTGRANWLYVDHSARGDKATILRLVARRILHQWYDCKGESGQTILLWLRKYFRKATNQGKRFDGRARKHGSSAEEISAWETWAKIELGNQVDSARWHLRMATALNTFAGMNRGYRLTDLRRRALARCEEALAADARLWRATLLKATIHKASSRFESALALLETIEHKNFEPQTQISEYDEALWTAILPTMADCQTKLMRFSEAEQSYTWLLEHELEKPKYTDNIERYFCLLMRALREQGKLAEALRWIQILDQRKYFLDKHKRQETSFLNSVLDQFSSDIHGHIIALADSERVEEMKRLYNTAMGQSGMKNRLEFLKLKLEWFRGHPEDRELIVQEWENLVYSDRFNLWVGPYRREVIKHLAQAYLILATESDIDASRKDVFIRRLEELDYSARHLLDYLLFCPTTLMHARVHFLNGQAPRAKWLLQASVRRALQLIKQDPKSTDGYVMLACILPVLDDKVNAQAAWSLLGPVERESYEGYEDELKPLSGSSTQDFSSPEASAVLGAARTDPVTPGQVNGHVDDPLIEQHGPVSDLDLDDVVHMYCDGRCGHSWKYADQIWLCKDCFDVQLDTHCYEKLQAGTLDVDVCNKNHRHFAVPAFDLKSWRALQKEEVVVDGKLTKRSEWLQKLEQDWEVDRWNYVLKFVIILQRTWLKKAHRRRSINPSVPVQVSY